MALHGPLDRDAILARIAGHPLGTRHDEMRKNFRGLVCGDGDRPDDAPRTFRPEAPVAGRPAIVWFHGGGYVFGGPDTHARIGEYLAVEHGFVVHVPHYPLAPEHAWPAQLDSARETAARWGLDGTAPILAGDSAGGHLALVTALAMARDGSPPSALLLFSPNTDRSGESGTRDANSDTDPMVDPDDDDRLAAMCFGSRSATDVEFSPLLDDLSLLPPTYIEVGSEEVLLDDSLLLAERLRSTDVEFGLTTVPGLPHMAQVWVPYWDEACLSLDRAATFALAMADPGGD